MAEVRRCAANVSWDLLLVLSRIRAASLYWIAVCKASKVVKTSLCIWLQGKHLFCPYLTALVFRKEEAVTGPFTEDQTLKSEDYRSMFTMAVTNQGF